MVVMNVQMTKPKVLTRLRDPIQRLVSSKRSFFASSTDHTTLLSNATVHCVTEKQEDGLERKQYILLPNETPLDLAIKVDKLHLARLFVQRNVIYGPKVVQRTLGTEADVCMPLLDAALNDLSSSNGGNSIALSSLGGLCKWVSEAIEKNSQNGESHGQDQIHKTLTQWKADDQTLYEAVKAIATGVPRPGHSVVGQGTYRDAEQGWTQLAEIYVKGGMAAEGNLYQKGGGQLNSIDYLADTSPEGLKYAGGAIARFQF